MYNARAQLLFCSLTFLFSDVPIPVVVEVFVKSQTKGFGKTPPRVVSINDYICRVWLKG